MDVNTILLFPYYIMLISAFILMHPAMLLFCGSLLPLIVHDDPKPTLIMLALIIPMLTLMLTLILTIRGIHSGAEV